MTDTNSNPIRSTFSGGRFWMIMAAVLVGSVLFFDDVVSYLLTDAPVETQRTSEVNPADFPISNGAAADEPSLFNDTDFLNADGSEMMAMAEPDSVQGDSAKDAADAAVIAVPTLGDVLTTLQTAGELIGGDALSASILLLQNGHDRLASRDSYMATFERCESVNGELMDDERISLKVRHAPFGVYMKWLSGDKGREVLYNNGDNEGRMLVRLGGLKGRFLPTLKLDPYGSRAMSKSRYPVTESGLLKLCRKLIDFRRSDLSLQKQMDCQLQTGAVCDDRESYYMNLVYADRNESQTYRKTRLHIDSESLLPVCIWNYTWPEDPGTQASDDQTLIEYYHYTDLHTDQDLPAAEFSSANSNYRFK